jgi:hypothetical protein
MAKRKDITTENDYLEQLQWRSRHSQRFSSVHDEPKWNYKIMFRTPPTTPFDKIGQALVFISFVAIAIFIFLSDSIRTGEKIFFGAIFGLIVVILFFAFRDGAKSKDEDSDESNDESGN